jgi:hypothetical protein
MVAFLRCSYTVVFRNTTLELQNSEGVLLNYHGGNSPTTPASHFTPPTLRAWSLGVGEAEWVTWDWEGWGGVLGGGGAVATVVI